DAEAAHLDLVIEATQELEVARRPEARQVSRPVETSARLPRPGVRHEPLRGQLRTAEVTPREARSTQEQLPRHSPGREIYPPVEDARAGAEDGPADRRRPRFGPRQERAGRLGRVLGRAVEFPDPCDLVQAV